MRSYIHSYIYFFDSFDAKFEPLTFTHHIYVTMQSMTVFIVNIYVCVPCSWIKILKEKVFFSPLFKFRNSQWCLQLFSRRGFFTCHFFSDRDRNRLNSTQDPPYTLCLLYFFFATRFETGISLLPSWSPLEITCWATAVNFNNEI